MNRDALEVLLDANPSRSLPATPLAKRRSNPLLFNPTDEPMFVDPMMTLPANLPKLSITVPPEDFIDPPKDLAGIQFMPLPPPEISDEGLIHGEPSSNKITSAIPGASIEVVKVDELQTASKEQPQRVIPIAVTESVATSQVKKDANRYVIKDAAWEKIRNVLSKDSDKNIVPPSYDMLPKQNHQSWLNASSGIEGLRAFLDMSD